MTVVRTPSETIRIREAGKGKILSAEVKLQKPFPSQRFQFGEHTSLEVNGDGSATWRF